MKRFKMFTILLAMVAVSITACKKEENDDNGDPDNTLGSMSMTVDGSDWTADFVIAVFTDEGLTVTGSENEGAACGIILEDITQTGTYQVGGNDNPHYCSWAPGTQVGNNFVAAEDFGTGTVTVTILNDNRAKGTFQFTGINLNQESKTITNGKFDVDLSFTK